MHGADVGRAGVDVLTINLVGEEVEVVLLDQVAYLVHLAAGIEITCGVVGVADKYGAGTLVDEFLEPLDTGQCKSFLYGGGDGADGGTCRHSKGHIVGIGGLGDDNLVAGIEGTHKGKEHGLRTAGGNDDIVGSNLDVILVIILCKFLSIAEITLRWRIFEHLTVNILEGIKSTLRGRQVGLTDIEVINFGATGLGCSCQRCQLTDWRFGHFKSANRNFWHNSNC